jgi:hypothetical protein
MFKKTTCGVRYNGLTAKNKRNVKEALEKDIEVGGGIKFPNLENKKIEYKGVSE